MAKEHSCQCHHTASREFPATSSQGLCFAPICQMDGGQRAAQGTLDLGMTSSLEVFWLVTVKADQVLGRTLRYTHGTTQGMTTHSPSSACKTHTMGAATIVKDAASVLRGLARRHLEVPCTMLVSQVILERQATSLITTAKPTPVPSWRTTASCA
jgi:hypothetical protein